MTATGGDGHTRVDLQAPRPPASPREVARAELHREASQIAAAFKDRTDPGALQVVRLCDSLRGALAALRNAERERDDAKAARRFADARVAFMERGAVEQQAQITALRTQLAEANELIKTVSAERFDEHTPARDSSADILREVAEFDVRPTVVR